MGSFPNLLPLNDDRLVSSEPSSEVSVFFEATATTLTKNFMDTRLYIKNKADKKKEG